MKPLRDTLFQIAEEHGGYLTAALAKAAGVRGTSLIMATKGGLVERVSRGVYRLAHFPLPEHPDLHEAVLWPQVRRDVRVAISHATALTLYGMSEVSPTAIDLTIPEHVRIRRAVPARFALHWAPLADADIQRIAGLPVTTPARSLRDAAAAGLSPSLIRHAIVDGNRHGHLTVREALRLARDLLGETIILNEQGLVARLTPMLPDDR